MADQPVSVHGRIGRKVFAVGTERGQPGPVGVFVRMDGRAFKAPEDFVCRVQPHGTTGPLEAIDNLRTRGYLGVIGAATLKTEVKRHAQLPSGHHLDRAR